MTSPNITTEMADYESILPPQVVIICQATNISYRLYKIRANHYAYVVRGKSFYTLSGNDQGACLARHAREASMEVFSSEAARLRTTL